MQIEELMKEKIQLSATLATLESGISEETKDSAEEKGTEVKRKRFRRTAEQMPDSMNVQRRDAKNHMGKFRPADNNN